MNKQNLEKLMNVIQTFEKPIEGFFNPISGTEEPGVITTYILGFDNEDEAEDFDSELENWDENEGPGCIERYLNYRIIQIIPYISTTDDEGNEVEALSENKALQIQNTVLDSLSTIECRKAYLWLFNYLKR